VFFGGVMAMGLLAVVGLLLYGALVTRRDATAG